MVIPSSQRISSESEMLPESRAVMPADLFHAAIRGDRNELIRRLGLQPEEQTEIQVTIEASHSDYEQINTENQTIQSELQSATPYGDTVLHLLVTEGHNELALKVFERDMSLLKAKNMMLETPLYCAAKVGNEMIIHNLIQIDRVLVKDALEETDENGGTALHIAAKNGQEIVGRELMILDPEVAYKVNKERLSPLYIAIVEGHTVMVQTMLEVDPTLACNKFSNEMFPVLEAARMGNKELVMHFMEKYPDDAVLRNSRGKNLFHIAAEDNNDKLFSGVFEDNSFGEMIERMNIATDYEGNTPFHIAAIKGHKSIMRAIWEHYQVAAIVPNRQGLTPFQLSVRQVEETSKYDIDDEDISDYVEIEGKKFTPKWFDYVMEPPLENVWEKIQVIGLGSVLITTVTFAAAFTIPGGYNQDHGTPVLGRRYIFRAFIMANTLAFIESFFSLFMLLLNVSRTPGARAFNIAIHTFLASAISMVVAFGLGMYVTLAPVCHRFAVFLLCIMVIGSPILILMVAFGMEFYKSIIKCDAPEAVMMPLIYLGSYGFIFLAPINYQIIHF